MYTLKVKSHFDAAHFLPWHEGKCKNLHGHRWEVEVVIRGEELENGILVDFAEVKRMLKLAMPDHTCLNDLIENPTAELIAKELYDNIDLAWNTLRCKGLRLVEVTVWESPNCSVTYRPLVPWLYSIDTSKLWEKLPDTEWNWMEGDKIENP